MRTFHELILDRQCESTGVYFPPDPWFVFLGQAHAIRFMIVADGVGGILPTLTVVLFESGNLSTGSAVKTLLSAVSLNADVDNIFAVAYGLEDAAYPPAKYMLPAVQLGGTDPKARVRIWATGRAPYSMPAVPPPPRTFRDEIERARLLSAAQDRPIEELASVSVGDLLP